jgi:hypothetical protein
MKFNNRTFHLLQKADILTCYEQTTITPFTAWQVGDQGTSHTLRTM